MRGLAMACMILVNNPGDSRYVYRELQHAPWNGWTVADFVFPFFLFLVGVCVGLAMDRDKVLAGQSVGFWPKVVKRGLVLFGLGLLENAYLSLGFADLRIPGVLQRIAIVYLASAWLHVRLGRRGVVAVVLGLLVGYWLVLTWLPVPGLGQPSLTSEANLEGWLDQLLLGRHIWKYGTTWDPEGILSTFPAIALGLIGVLTGRWLRLGGQETARVLALGLAMLLFALFWNRSFPINKSLCTSPFVLFTGGAGVMLLAASHWLLDMRGRVAWAKPLIILGTNPLAAYVASSFLASTLRHVQLVDGLGRVTTLQAWLYGRLFSAWAPSAPASLAWGVLYLLPLFLGIWLLYTRRIVIKV
jgi:predicted acyltransferase